ncbi:hypothetical protein AGMMS50256_07970 [Betaproteobacteria bacterium]|nr:hypothetical protein AGMMS50256_07970 [Betaproteobacteria bacterium]
MKVTKKWSKMLMVGMSAMVLTLGLVLGGCGHVDLNSAFFGEEDTSINWVMAPSPSVPSLNSLEKLSATSREASAIYRYGNRALAELNKWYVFTAPEKPGEIYYAVKDTSSTVRGAITVNAVWQVYKQRKMGTPTSLPVPSE